MTVPRLPRPAPGHVLVVCWADAVLYCITPEFTILHWLNVYGWRYVVGLLGNFIVNDFNIFTLVSFKAKIIMTFTITVKQYKSVIDISWLDLYGILS